MVPEMKKNKTNTEAINVSESSRLLVRQVKSVSGRLKNQRQTIIGLGLGKINRQVELDDTPSIRGMIKTVQHLVEVTKK